MSKDKKVLLLFMFFLLLFSPFTSLASNSNAGKAPKDVVDKNETLKSESMHNKRGKENHLVSNMKMDSIDASNIQENNISPLSIENLTSELINKEPPKVRVEWTNPSEDTDLIDNGLQLRKGSAGDIVIDTTVKKEKADQEVQDTRLYWEQENLDYNTFYNFCVNQIYNNYKTDWRCTSVTTPDDSGDDISNPPPVEYFDYDPNNTDPPSVDTEWKNPDYNYFAANGWEIHKGNKGNVVNQGLFDQTSAGTVETSTVTKLDYDTYYILRRNVISEDGSESEWTSVSFTTPQKDDDGGGGGGGGDDDGGGGGSSSGCIITPSSSFGMGWLLLLTIPGLMILRRFSK